jgi:hypothetical protein
MSERVVRAGCDWATDTRDEAEKDGMLGEFRGHRLEVFSSEDSDEWCYRIDDGETRFGYESRIEAMRDAVQEARTLGAISG